MTEKDKTTESTSKSHTSKETVTTASEEKIKSTNKAGTTVFVEISYPKGFEGRKFFKDGEVVEVSPETAKIIVDKQIGKVKYK